MTARLSCTPAEILVAILVGFVCYCLGFIRTFFIMAREIRQSLSRRSSGALSLATALVLSVPHAGLALPAGCIDADPASQLTAITGDFELAADPDDPAQNMLFVSNATGGSPAPQPVLIARLNGKTGVMISGSLTTVASNFAGYSNQNGPEWMRTPEGSLGIIYVDADGVHGLYRSAHPANWSDFLYDYAGRPAFGAPPPLPDTTPGYYPADPAHPPAEAATILQYQPPCTSFCFGAYNAGKITDLALVLSPLGYTTLAATLAPWDGYVYVSACKIGTNVCGIYQARIDGAGGLSSFDQIASTGLLRATDLDSSMHPVAGTPVLFTNETPGTFTIWQQPGSGAQLTSVAKVTIPKNTSHLRSAASATQVVLDYFVRYGVGSGSYTIPVSANGTTLVVGANKKVSARSSGSELDWFPAAAKWGITYRTQTKLTRCWVTP
ncbi:MAG: hypothetical protein JSR21_02135 [Proteobacteria bacterium]|nr:hypothetical protein [Pseudomonadota bacterium]